MQTEIFEKEKVKKATAGLMISTRQKNTLSKQQQGFNKLIKKIENLRLELDQVNKSMNEKLGFYGKYIYPLEQQLTELNKEGTKLLYWFYENKKLLQKKERQSLGKIISAQLNHIFKSQADEPEEELKKIFKAVEGISYEKAAEEDFNIMRDEMESMFEEFGFEMNFDDLHGNMTQEEILKKALEMGEQMKQQADEEDKRQTNRKKTKKQKEKEERERQMEEARTKNIGSIYRQLAKVFHPDLERDEELKQEKEELMKQLTIAYEKNDLHTLLSLELAWIQKEENNPGQLTDDKLGIYNEVLKEQVYELEQDISDTLHHPRYQPLQKFATFPHQIKSINLHYEKQKIEEMKNDIARDIALLKGNEKQALRTVKDIIRSFEIQIRSEIDFSRFF